MAVPISARTLKRAFVVGSAVVSLAGLAAEVARFSLGFAEEGLVSLFSLSWEANIPTWYAATLALACATLLAISGADAKARGERAASWWLLTAGFFYIAMDEVSQLHELAAFFDLRGVLYFSWIIPAAVVVALVGLSLIPFLRSLEAATRIRFLVAGAIYVGGAVAMELPLGWWTDHYGVDTLGYALIDWAEESMELVGLTLFLASLVDRLAKRELRIRFATAEVAR
ncbi:MAG: hypothetical protein HOW73_16300 [Polyangiaceae bacterium]|nr:hypothetical protein [Polyangiaceae bacterium]